MFSSLNNFISINYWSTFVYQIDNLLSSGSFRQKAIAADIIPQKDSLMAIIHNPNYLTRNLPETINHKSPYNDYIINIALLWNKARNNLENYQKRFTDYYHAFREHPLNLPESFIVKENNLVRIPNYKNFKKAHPDALDIFFSKVTKIGEEEIGPEILSISSGVVVAAENNWSGGNTKSSYQGGGISPKGGNGVIIFNPENNRFYVYLHLHHCLVKTGDIVQPGKSIGIGGNTGINARKPGHGSHVHFEIYDCRQRESMSSRILYKSLFNSQIEHFTDTAKLYKQYMLK